MNPYEVMFIVDPNVEGEEAVDQYIERYGRLIIDQGGEVTGVDKWGKKRLAFEIKGLTEGYYVVIQFKSDDAVVNELNRIMKIADDIVRHMVVRLEEAEPVAEQPDETSETEATEAAPAPVAETEAAAEPTATS